MIRHKISSKYDGQQFEAPLMRFLNARYSMDEIDEKNKDGRKTRNDVQKQGCRQIGKQIEQIARLRRKG